MASVHPLTARSDGIGPTGTLVEPPVDIDLREVLGKLWRRKGTIVGTTLVLTVVAALAIFQITKLFTAQSMVMINDRQTQIVDIEAVMSGLVGDAETIASEIEVIRSRGLAAKTIEALRLDQRPEFNGTLRAPSALTAMLDPHAWIPSDWQASILGDDAEGELSAEDAAERQSARIVDEFLDKLDVAPVGVSRAIRIDFTSENPRVAAAVANQLADFYIVSQLEAKFEATQRANDWLSGRLAELRDQVNKAERAVEAFRQQSGLIQSDDETTLKTQEISDLNAQLVVERTKRAEAEARLRQVEQLLNGPNGPQAVGQILQSPLIQSLREQQAEVERQAAELSQEYGEKHPRIINVRAEAEDLRSKIAEEVDRIVQGLRNEVGVARAREGTLSAALDHLRNEVGAANTDQVTLRALEREAQASRTLLETFLLRSKETGGQENFQQADASVISRADVPEVPSYPRKTLLLLVSVVAAGLIGLCLAIVLEMLDHGFRSMEQIERQMGAQPLGLVPAISGLAKLRRSPDSRILDKPASAYAEAIRSLYTGLLLSGGEAPPRTVLVASALPREGKTSIALSLARMLASTGHKVVVVDCDLRRPTAHKAFGAHSQPGLVEVLLGKQPLAEVLARDPRSGAALVPAGEPVPNPADLFGTPQMKRFLAGLAERYDLVILDSPPVLAVSDARVLARLVDRTLFLVRWADTRRERAIAGWRQLVDAGGKVAGVALTQVDVKRHAQYGYSDSGYYHGRVKKYYTG